MLNLRQDIFDDPKFFKEGAGYDDIVQGGLGDCWMMSAFSVLSCKQELLERVCVIRDEEGTSAVSLRATPANA